MSKIKVILVAGMLSALALASLGVPAAAFVGSGTLAVVNGIPGAAVDVCLNGQEIRSGLRYGGVAFRTVLEGDKSLRVFRADPRRCKGTLLASKSFPLVGGADLTLVATKKDPKVVVFDNTGLGVIPPVIQPIQNASYFVWRHAADAPVNIYYQVRTTMPETPIGPSALPVWVKGNQISSTSNGMTEWRLRATPLGLTTTFAGTTWVRPNDGRRYEWYLVGTSKQNARFVIFSRAVSQSI